MSSSMLDHAMVIDLDVLQKLLRRNWCAQRRTLYFQRISMVVRAVQRYQVETLRPHIQQVRKSLEKRERKQEDWVLNQSSLEEDEIYQQLESLRDTLTIGLPEILSRIQHASSALLAEIARGFFLPFCTVAMAALARIYALVRRLGQEGLSELIFCWNMWDQQQSKKEGSSPRMSSLLVENAMEAFVQELDVNSQFLGMQRQYRNETRKSLGLGALTTEHDNDMKQAARVTLKSEDDSTAKAVKEDRNKSMLASEAVPIKEETELSQQLYDDMGESVDFGLNQERVDVTSEPSLDNNNGDPDANMKLLNRLQSKRPKETQEAKNKRKRDNKDKPKKKKKRKKERKKKDVFDEIFGDT